jgi:hypothetical protein
MYGEVFMCVYVYANHVQGCGDPDVGVMFSGKQACTLEGSEALVTSKCAWTPVT